MNPVQEIRRLWQCVCELNVAATGPEGPQGPEGPEGPMGSCMQLPYTYEVSDDQTPAPGFFQIDAGTIFINGIDGNAEDRTATFDSLVTGLFIFSGELGSYFYARITAQAENAGIYELTISNIDGTEPVSSTVGCILFIPDSTGFQPLDAALTALAGGSDFVRFTGPTTSIKDFALPDASSTILVSGGALGTPSGGNASNLTNLDATDLSGKVPGASIGALPVVVKVTAASYTVGTTDPNELYGGIIYVTAAATITIPAIVAGMNFTVITIGNVAVSVDPDAADKLYLEGVALSDGDKITNLSTSGDIAVITYYDATGFVAITNGWTDTN